MNKDFSLALHGGAGTITRGQMTAESEKQYKETLEKILEIGYSMLTAGGSAIDVVEKTVSLLEDSPLFNAGKGAVFTHEGKHEMDASIMDGSDRNAGAVAGINGIQNPIKLARMVMDKSEHLMLVGLGAMDFARSMGMAQLEASYFYDELRYQQWQEALKSDSVQLDHSPLNEKKFGTVGAVAKDQNGNLAAATSTGGMTNKKFGRVGDSPVIGAGTYANNETCAISCTGTGEFFMRGVVAYDVSCLMEYRGYRLEKACNEVIQTKMLELGGDGGLIAVDHMGNISLSFNTEGMYRAAKSSRGIHIVEIYK